MESGDVAREPKRSENLPFIVHLHKASGISERRSSPDKFQANIFLSGKATEIERDFPPSRCSASGIIDKMDRKLFLFSSFFSFSARGTFVDRFVESSGSQDRFAAENPYFSGVFIDAGSLNGD